MRLWRRLLVFLLAAIVLNCYARGETITLAYSLENYDLGRYFAEFTQQTGIDIEFAKLTTSGMKKELLLRADTQSLPDVVIVPGDLLGLEVASFSTVANDWLSPDILTTTLSHGQVRGIQKGVPIIAGNHLLLYFNKALVKDPAVNWSSLKETTREAGRHRNISWSYNEMFWLIPFLGAWDAYPYKNGNIKFNTSGVREALTFYKELADEGLVNAKCNYQCAFDAFIHGQVAYTINGSWSLGGFREKLGDNLGIAMLPAIGKKRMKPYSSVHALAFPDNGSDSHKKQALKKLSLYFQSYSVQQQIWNDIRALPVNHKLLQSIKRTSSQDTVNLLSQLEESEPMPNDPEMAIIWEAMLMGFNRYQGEAMDIDEALQYMQYIAVKSRDEQR